MLHTMVQSVMTLAISLITIIGSLFAFVKWAWPPIVNYLERYVYYHKTGVHVIRDIEANFGREAGRAIRDILMTRGSELILDEARLDIIENAVGLGIYICDPAGRCTYANKTLAKMFGMQQHDMLGYGWFHPIVDKPKAFTNWNFSIDNNVPYMDVYDIIVQGETKRISTEAEYSEAGSVIIGFVGIAKEIKQK